jgi:hypothetical protein
MRASATRKRHMYDWSYGVVLFVVKGDGGTLDDKASVNNRDKRKDAFEVGCLNIIASIIEGYCVDGTETSKRPIAAK